MVVDNTHISVNNVLIENAKGYVNLGQHYSLKEKNQDKEIQRRIMAGWATYAKHRDIFKSNLAICPKHRRTGQHPLGGGGRPSFARMDSVGGGK